MRRNGQAKLTHVTATEVRGMAKIVGGILHKINCGRTSDDGFVGQSPLAGAIAMSGHPLILYCDGKYVEVSGK